MAGLGEPRANNAHASFLPSVVLVDRKIINSIHKKISPGCNSRDCHIVFACFPNITCANVCTIPTEDSRCLSQLVGGLNGALHAYGRATYRDSTSRPWSYCRVFTRPEAWRESCCLILE